MKYVLLLTCLLLLCSASACSSALSHGDQSADDNHAFLVTSSQILDELGTDTAPEEEAYLVIKYEIENLQSHDDIDRRWVDQITLESRNEYYSPISINSLEDQLWETSLAGHEKRTGYIAFLVPADAFDFTLTFAFPVSGNDIVYELHAVDKRINMSVDWVLDRLRTIENNKKIPLIGKTLALSNPIRYQGVVLVPKADLPQLIEQTEGLSEDSQKTVIEDYLLSHGHCRLE